MSAPVVIPRLTMKRQIPVYQHRLDAVHWVTARLAADERYHAEVKPDA